MPDDSPPRTPNVRGDRGAGVAAVTMSDLPAVVLDAIASFEDFDIQVLYEILQVAQADPTYAARPYQAIFPAHEAVLGEHSLSRASPDSPYLRFLYRLPGLRNGAEELIDVFERVLTQVGITIESASEGSGGDRTRLSEFSVQRDFRPLAPNDQELEKELQKGDESELRQHNTRRSSFSDFIDEEWRNTPRKRSASRASVSRLQGHSKGFGARMPKGKEKAKEERTAKDSKIEHVPVKLKPQADNSPKRPKRTVEPKTRIHSQPQKGRGSVRKQRSHPGLAQTIDLEQRDHGRAKAQRPPSGKDDLFAETPITAGTLSREALNRLELLWRSTEHENSAANPIVKSVHEEANDTIQDFVRAQRAAGGDDSIDSGNEMVQEELLRLPIPTPAQLERDARTYIQFRIWHLASTLLRKWRQATFEQRERLRESRASADYLDRRVLLEQGFQRWKETYKRRKYHAKVESFYRSLDERAIKARNFHLLAKAFTHWAEYGAEERRRSESARRHILRLKYFHAWQEITNVHQLKIRQFTLRKFFTKWKTGLVRTLIQENRAEGWHRRQVAQNAYSAWFWKFCTDRAPQWRDGTLLKRYFSRWTAATEKRDLTTLKGSAIRQRYLLKDSFDPWRRRTAQAKQHAQDASAFQRTQIVARALPQWQTQLRLALPARQTQGIIERRIVSKAFTTWGTRLAMAEQARNMDVYRLVRTVWTQWNESLRVRVMEQQRARRLISSCLYKWVLAERSMHFKRVSEDQALERGLNVVVEHFRKLKSTLQQKEEQFADLQNRKLLRIALGKWHEKHRQNLSWSQQAHSTYKPRTNRRVLQRWYALYNYQIGLSVQADSTQNYFCGTHALKIWRAAASNSRKQKLQSAYATVRVKNKKALAHLVLRTWIARTNYALSLVDEAETFLYEHLWEVANLAFANWARALEDAERADTTAALQRKASLLNAALQSWSMRSTLGLQQVAQAEAFQRSGAEKTSYECLRHLQLKALEQNNLRAKANTVRSWTTKRLARMLLRRLAEVAANRIAAAQAEQEQGPAPRLGLFSGPHNYSITEETRRQREGRAFTEEARRSVADWIQPPLPPALHLRRQLDAAGNIQTGSLSPLPPYLSTPSRRAARARAMVPSFTPQTEPQRLLLRSMIGFKGDLGEEPIGLPKLGRQGAATVGRRNTRDGRSFIPTAASGPETPSGRSLFQRRGGDKALEDDSIGQSLRPSRVEESED